MPQASSPAAMIPAINPVMTIRPNSYGIIAAAGLTTAMIPAIAPSGPVA